jgi:hypothetical protein
MLSKNRLLVLEKFILLILLLGFIIGFWFFELALTLRILVIFLAIFGASSAFFVKTSKTLQSPREFLILLILYLGILNLYNLLYGLGLPTPVAMLAILLLSSILTYCLVSLDDLQSLISRPVINLFIALTGLINLEIFLTLSFWPIDPQAKSLIIVIFFYLIISLFYLYAHNVLRLKRIMGFLIASIVLLGLLVLVTWLGFLKH